MHVQTKDSARLARLAAKPQIAPQAITEIETAIIQGSPARERLWIGYGAALCASGVAVLQAFGVAPTAPNLAVLIVVALAHWRVRDQFGLGDALNKVDQFDVTPSAEIRAIENDREYKAWGINVTKDDWPELFKTGLRVCALRQIETFESRALSVVGYGAAVLMLLSH